GLGNLNQLAMRVIGTEIDRCADRGRTHFVGLLDRAKEDLLEAVWIRQQLIMVDLDQKRDLVRILACHYAKDSKRGSNRIAAAFDGKFDNVFRVEVIRVLRKARPAGMLDTLIDRQNG